MAKLLITDNKIIERIKTIKEQVAECSKEAADSLLKLLMAMDGSKTEDETMSVLEEADAIKNAGIDFTVEVNVNRIEAVMDKCKEGDYLFSINTNLEDIVDTACILSKVAKISDNEVNFINYKVGRDNAMIEAMNKVLTGMGDENTPIIDQPMRGQVLSGTDPSDSIIEVDTYILTKEEANLIMNEIFLNACLFKTPNDARKEALQLLNLNI